MNKTVRTILLLLGALVLLSFVLFVIGQTSRVVELAARLHPAAGPIALWSLLGLYAALLAAIVVSVVRLPPPLRPPKSVDSPEFEEHLDNLKRRLRDNPHVRELGGGLESRQDVEQALGLLGTRADKLNRDSARQVFYLTALSQNGAIDAFVVLALLVRLVWRVGHVYYQRPTLRDMIYLYSNVAATAFVAAGIEDMDITELAPTLASTSGGSLEGIPFLAGTSRVVANAMLSGTANCYLFLRAGILTKRYCGMLVQEERRTVRKSAFLEAAKLLGVVVAEASGQVTRALGRGVARRASWAVSRFSGRRDPTAGPVPEKPLGTPRRDPSGS
jgi:hypothetical protein